MFSKRLPAFFLVSVAILLFSSSNLLAQGADQKPIVAPAAAAKFGPIPNAPECFTIAVEQGDPTKGPSVILAKFAPGCVAPFHWHTPSETVMVVGGSLQTQMKGEAAFVGHKGDYVFLPPRHAHRATCIGTAPCLVFLVSDGAFDIHWIDAAGKEISLEEALRAVKSAKAAAAAKP